jgi:uncharacterized protein (TIGR03435 family)
MSRLIAISLLTVLSARNAFGQSTFNSPAFEVAAVKVNRSGGPGPEKERFLPGGRIELSNATLREMIVPAYGVKGNMIMGGPKWIDSERFDIVAKAAPDTPVATLLLMIRNLLEERFQLHFHHDDKVMPAYALKVGRGGFKLRPASGGRQNCSSRPGEGTGVQTIRRECRNITMPEFVRQLGLGRYGVDDRPVVDLTGLTGTYDFEFEYSRPPVAGRDAPVRDDSERTGDGYGAPDFAGPTIFDAMAQLGLKLETTRQTVPVIVIDRAELPVE